MSEEGDVQTPAKKKGDKPAGKIQLQNVVPLVDCWAVMDTPLDFSFMKLTRPAGRCIVVLQCTAVRMSASTGAEFS